GPEDVERIANADRLTRRLRPKTDISDAEDSDGDTIREPTLTNASASQVSPEERIEEALAEVRESVGRDLLENIGRAAPEFFEQLVLDLLHAMGYGTSRSDLQRVGGSGDGGIDGIISLDRLGLEKVYVQAKRWK